VKSNAVALSFDQNGKLMNYSGSASAIGTGMGAASGVTPERTESQPRQQPPASAPVSALTTPPLNGPNASNLAPSASAQSTSSSDKPSLGIRLAPVDPVMVAKLGLDEPRGLVVTGVNPDGPAVAAGIQSLDVLLKVNGKEIVSQEQFRQIMDASSHGDIMTFEVWRTRRKQSVAVKL
jgi:membrane-associated protease RseP (regulator of RpoE activity)